MCVSGPAAVPAPSCWRSEGKLTQDNDFGSYGRSKSSSKSSRTTAAAAATATTNNNSSSSSSRSSSEGGMCVCGRGFEGRMVACDRPNCFIEWFHFECIGLEREVTYARYVAAAITQLTLTLPLPIITSSFTLVS